MTIAHHSDEEVQRALELLERADVGSVERALNAVSASADGILTTLRGVLGFHRAVDELGGALATLDSTVSPSVARAAQATENIWRGIEAEFGLLSSAEVASLLGASNANRTYAASLRRRGELMGVQRKNAFVHPGFQINRDTSRPYPWVAPLLALAEEHERSVRDAVIWMVAPSAMLNGDRPVDHRGDAERLLSLAARAWNIAW